MKKIFAIVVLIISILSLTLMIKKNQDLKNYNCVYHGDVGSINERNMTVIKVDTNTVNGGHGGCAGKAIYSDLPYPSGHFQNPIEEIIGTHGGTIVLIKDTAVFNSQKPRSGGGQMSVVTIDTCAY